MRAFKIVEIPIFNTSVCFFIGDDIEILKLLKEDNPHKIDDEIYKQILEDIDVKSKCDGFTAVMLDESYFVYIKDGFELNPRVVIHEIFHVVNFVLTHRDVYHEETAETWAYMMGWLTEEYYKFINEEESKNNEKNRRKKTWFGRKS